MKKAQTPSLINGQWWHVKGGYVRIVSMGKTLVDYKMLKNPGQKAARTQMGSVAGVLAYLKTNKARLVVKPAAPLKRAA
jgi:hypothetical protein